MIKNSAFAILCSTRIDGKRLNCRVKYSRKIGNLQDILGPTCISMTTCLDGVFLLPGEVVGEFILHPGLDESVTAQL